MLFLHVACTKSTQKARKYKLRDNKQSRTQRGDGDNDDAPQAPPAWFYRGDIAPQDTLPGAGGAGGDGVGTDGGGGGDKLGGRDGCDSWPNTSDDNHPVGEKDIAGGGDATSNMTREDGKDVGVTPAAESRGARARSASS